MKVTPFAAEAAASGVEDVRGEHTPDRYERTDWFRVYEPMLIPGPLQHPDYAGAVQRFWECHLRPDHDWAQRDAHVRKALERHAERSRLALGSNRFEVVLEEATLRRSVAGPAVLDAALQHLLELMRDTPSLSVSVIPFGAPCLGPALSPFWILDGELVALEVPSASLPEEDWGQVAHYERLFAQLQESAVTGYAARRLVMDAREQASRG